MCAKFYTKEEQELALKEFERLGSVTAVIHKLGYPSRAALYQWYERKKSGCLNNHGTMEYNNMYQNSNKYNKHEHIASQELKLETLRRCFEDGEPVEYVSREIGYCRVTIYQWRKIFLSEGAIGLMTSNKKITRDKFLDKKIESIPVLDVSEMQKKIKELELDVDILKETINILKKDPGVDMTMMKNNEKVLIVDALKNRYTLPLLLGKLDFAKSSYYYQIKARNVDKYADFRDLLAISFHENNDCYGYRRLHVLMKKLGYIVSEKVVLRLMKEENLIVYKAKKKKYSSYKWEISSEVKNIINRNFHSDAPNTKWLTDITEFGHPEGKVYLSPIIDCFDGKVVSWTVGTSPNANLVNAMLKEASKNLSKRDHPIVHSDRGCHYRWPGWIELMDKFELTRSMSKKGCSPDNSACEGFFGRMKNEFFYGKKWTGISLNEFIVLINNYIHWYNEKRIKASLGYMSPVEYRESLGIIS